MSSDDKIDNKFDVKNHFESLTPSTQTKLKKSSVIIVLLAVCLALYYGSGRAEKNKEVILEDEIRFDDELLETDIRDSISKDLEQDKKEDEAQRRAQDEALVSLIATVEAMQKGEYRPLPNTESSESSSTPYGESSSTPYGEFPTASAFPPVRTDSFSHQYSDEQQYSDMENLPPVEEVIGGISKSVGNPPSEKKEAESKKKIIRLPPSFMKATLLVGIDAMTSELGVANPEPVMLRIQAPAVLPNSVKRNLKGCFVIANVTGNLAKERVQAKLVSIHCNSRDGKAVIDQKIRGFVADKDGKKDMAGIVISKAGSNMARAALASFASGVGNNVSQIGSTTTSTIIGTETEVDPDKLLIGGFAKGFGAASNEFAQVYLDLVKQSTPTIEVGAAKKLTVVIQETVDLEIKNYD